VGVAGDEQGGMGRYGPQPGPESFPVPGRSCGTCSLCCKVFAVQELSKPAGQWCIHAVARSGCRNYDNRPRACREFLCSWRLDPKLGPEWKPEVSRFVLSEDRDRGALTVTVDPGMPLAWKREPYYTRLKQLSEILFPENKKVLVSLRGQTTVILPDRDVPIGPTAPGEDIIIWRSGLAYGAASSRRDQPPAPVATGLAEPRRGPIPGGGALPPSLDEPGLLRSVFHEAFERACRRLDDEGLDDLAAVTAIIRDRNRALDEIAETYAKAASAECDAGCTSCCYLMVLGSPLEILSIARRLLETKTPAELEVIKTRLQRACGPSLDFAARLKAKVPCGLLENGRCTIYESRPGVCRVMLSQSRAACDACLNGKADSIPYIEQPSKIGGVMQMGIDYALLTRRKLSSEDAELSRALLTALADYDAVLATWLIGQDPFPGSHVDKPGARSGAEKALEAARRFGLA
jgi:hypothetical protein